MKQEQYVRQGVEPGPGGKAIIMVHGRGADAEDIIGLAGHFPLEDFTIIAPRAAANAWYPYSFLAPVHQNQPALDKALGQLAAIASDLEQTGVRPENIYWLGFSQGACLTLEYVCRHATRFGGVIAFTGGLIGQTPDLQAYNGAFNGTPVFIGTSDPDHHVPVARVEESAAIIRSMGADLLVRIYPDMGHTITADEIRLATSHVFRN